MVYIQYLYSTTQRKLHRENPSGIQYKCLKYRKRYISFPVLYCLQTNILYLHLCMCPVRFSSLEENKHCKPLMIQSAKSNSCCCNNWAVFYFITKNNFKIEVLNSNMQSLVSINKDGRIKSVFGAVTSCDILWSIFTL